LFTPDVNFGQLQTTLLAELKLETLPANRIDELVDREWSREWMKDFGPMQFGNRLWIYPTDHPLGEDDTIVVRLDPGLAFGTGTHATTALCLEWLDGLSLGDKTLLDYGCGSGVLAIAALKLGCHSATAMDIDPQAILASQQNASDNNVAERLHIVQKPGEIEGVFDVVVANILAGPLVEFAESITLTLAGRGMLALYGVLCEQADDVLAAYEPWIKFDEPTFRAQDGQTWSRLTGQRY
jgi:ribosomal protein L11 methyltransferase